MANFGYIRVSLDRQSLSPIAQRDTILKLAATRDWTVDYWFQDAPVVVQGVMQEASSGGKPMRKRRAGGEMVRRVRRGDRVIVAKLDRAFRGFLDGAVQLDEWDRLGVTFVCSDLGFDIGPENPMGQALVRMLLVFAELERKMISQRTKEAMAVRKNKHQPVSFYPGYGFKWQRTYDQDTSKWTKTKAPCPEERAQMKALVVWHNEGWSWEQCAQKMAGLGWVTKHGRPWNWKRCVRAWAAELRLELQEGSAGENLERGRPA